MNSSKLAMLVLTVIIFISFFLPWVNIESAVVGGLSKILTSKESAAISSISGFKVPVLANGPDSRLMISIIQLFNPGVKDADKKSYLVWLIPGLAVLMFVLLWLFGKNKWLNLILGLVGILIFLVAVFKITTTNMDKLVMKVSIGCGLWILLAGYLCIGLLCGINFIKLNKGARKG